MSHNYAINYYYKQLDSLRAFAVILVIISHWMPSNHWLNFLPNGIIGVTIFFVLSGFLITQILINNKFRAIQRQLPKLYVFRQFFIRRALRIFPIYYVLIFSLYLIPFTPQSFKANFSYYALYASNFYFFKINNWDFGAHLWTLAVEEQFYLIWPFVILFTPNRQLFKTILLFIAIGVISRYFYSGQGTPLTAILTPTCFDSFGLGALLALHKMKANTSNYFKNSNKLVQQIFVLSISICLISLFIVIPYWGVMLRFIISIIAYCLIYFTTSGFSGIGRIILENKFIIYLGKISYSIYLFHNFIPWAWSCIREAYMKNGFRLHFDNINIAISFTPLTNLFICLLLLMAFSTLSWFLIEKPMNNLKKYFDYLQ